MKRFSILMLFSSLFVASALAQDEPIRLYRFGTCENNVVKNEAVNKDAADTDLNYAGKGKEQPEILQSPVGFRDGAGFPFARIDNSPFRAKPFEVGDAGFTLRARIRKNGQGKELGNGNPNGTIVGLGVGYNNGFRVITDNRTRRISFEMGREKGAFNLSGTTPVPDGEWIDVAVSWDRKKMRIFVDGLPYAATDYAGDFVKPSWEFRVGFNNAGVGSLKMDVDEIAVYDKALAPMTIYALALGLKPIGGAFAESFDMLPDALQAKDFSQARELVDKLLALRGGEKGRAYQQPLRIFRADLLAMSGAQTRAMQMYTALLADPDTPQAYRTRLLRKCIPTELRNPIVAADSTVYQGILKATQKSTEIDAPAPMIELSPEQTAAIRLCLYRALQLEGKADEAAALAKEFSIAPEQELAKYDFEHWKAEKAERDAEEKRFRETGAAWETPQPKNPIPATFKPAKTFVVRQDIINLVDSDGQVTSAIHRKDDGTFATLQEARDAIRKLKADNGGKLPAGGVEVLVLAQGTITPHERNTASLTIRLHLPYQQQETFELTAEDSGTPEAPIVYRALKGERPVFAAGRKIDTKLFQLVDDADLLARLPEESRGKVFVCDLEKAGVDWKKLPPMAQRGYGYSSPGAPAWVDLYLDDKPLQIARYPNAGTTAENTPPPILTGEVTQGKMGATDGSQNLPPIFGYADSRIERWMQAEDPWVMGYWGHLWGCNTCPIKKIDTENKRLELGMRNSYQCREKMPYYAYNMLEEIDVPGEWYLDRKNGKLYVYPPEGTDMGKPGSDKVENTGDVFTLSVFDKPFIRMKDCSHVIFENLAFENSCTTGAVVEGGEHVVFVGCSFKRLGGWAIQISGKNHGVLSCDLDTLGGGGVWMDCGDYRTLTPGNGYVENCHIRTFTRIDRAYAPAVQMHGSGNRIAHNLMHDSPNHAIRLEGMEQLVEFNEIHSVVYESDDQSGIDIWGNPYMRGFVFRYNYFHHIGSGHDVAGQAGIRLDDMISSVLMYGNAFFRSSGGHFGGIQIHGGKDNISDNNLFVDCKYAFSYSPWGEKRWLELLVSLGDSCKKRGFDPDSTAYRAKYADLAPEALKSHANRNFATRNLAVACDQFARNERGQNEYAANLYLPWNGTLFTEVRTTQKDTQDGQSGDSATEAGRVPKEVTAYRGTLSIPYDAPIWKAVEMRPLPFPLMGLYLDTYRTERPPMEINPLYVAE